MSRVRRPPENDECATDALVEQYVQRMLALKQTAESSKTPEAIAGDRFDHFVRTRYFGAQHRRAISNPRTSLADERRPFRRRRFACWSLGALLLLLLCIDPANVRQYIVGQFMVHIQTWIYPGMSWWRLATAPVLRTFPALSTLYDETCLLSNPFFHIDDMDCRPCADVHSVLDLTADGRLGNDLLDEHRPFVFRDANRRPALSLRRLQQLFANHSRVFRRDAYAVRTHWSPASAVAAQRIGNLDELFAAHGLGRNGSTPSTVEAGGQFHALWRLNRLHPVRLLRTLTGQPARLPRTGLHIERYVAVDTPAAPAYRLPDLECAKVFVAQQSGVRTIVLRPSAECADGRCRTVSVRLPEGSVLLYDWWYWRPISMADSTIPSSGTTSISYIGAYC